MSKADSRPRMTGAERRDQILDILAKLILDEGYASVSIDRVARDVGVARTVIYSHFENLEALHSALADRNEQRIFGQIQESMPDLDTGEEVDLLVIAAFERYLDAVLSDPDTWRLALSPQDGAPLPLRDRVTRNRAAVVALLTPICELGLTRRGGPEGIDAELLAHMILANGEEAGRIVLDSESADARDRLLAFVRGALAALAP